jgi:hypothetical protein
MAHGCRVTYFDLNSFDSSPVSVEFRFLVIVQATLEVKTPIVRRRSEAVRSLGGKAFRDAAGHARSHIISTLAQPIDASRRKRSMKNRNSR